MFAQLNHQVSVQTGIYNNQIVRFSTVEGAGSYDHKNSFMVGISYEYRLNSKVSIKPQFNWQSSKLTFNNVVGGDVFIRQNIEISSINIPILISYNFNKFFFIDAGPVIHFETENAPQNYLDHQNGIGFALGAGIQYTFSGFSLSAKPNLQMLSLLPFGAENYHERLLSSGFVFGLGYNF